MEEDFKLLLNEYTRIISSDLNIIESYLIIPLLLKHGAFTPSRLERWPFLQMVYEMNRDDGYRNSVIRSFTELVSLDYSSDTFVLNEKKAVSFLLAARDSCPNLLRYLNDAILNSPRIHLATIEFNVYTTGLRLRFQKLPIPFPQMSTLAPKFMSKYPLLVEMFTTPSLAIVRTVLERLKRSPEPLEEFECRCILDSASRFLDSKTLYTNVLTLIWNDPNKSFVNIVLDSLKLNSDLKDFCTLACEEF